MTPQPQHPGLLWPAYHTPDGLAAIEAVPLGDRGLPATTHDALRRASLNWPAKTTVTVMPDAARWRESASATFAQPHGDVVAAANLPRSLGVNRADTVAPPAPTATS